MRSPSARKVAIVHDWLPLYGGAERVLEQILLVLPQADIFSMIDAIPPEQRGFLQNKPVTTSFVQKLPSAKTRYRSYLPDHAPGGRAVRPLFLRLGHLE